MSKVLIVDGGGRGSALVDKYSRSPEVSEIFAVPGNDLMGLNIKKPVITFPNIKTIEKSQILKIAKNENIDLVDVSQDNAIAVGLVNLLNRNKFKVLGPTKEAGRLEWDKAFSRRFMKKYKIPSPTFKICKSQSGGIEFINNHKDSEWYVKASGLASGKGAIYANNNKIAIKAIHEMKRFGTAGSTYLIEECLHGEEFSSFAVVSGRNFKIIGHAQDHKTVYDGNLGPNTGGMGCSSPPLIISNKIENNIKSIFKKTVEGLVKENTPYVGVLYLGGMLIDKDKIKVIEFNARWGDPEAQVIIPGVKNDFYKMAQNIISGKINKLKIIKDTEYRITVAIASKGYPQNRSEVIKQEIIGIDKILKLKNVVVYGSGIKIKNKKYLASSGRLLYLTANGKNVVQARKRAYSAISLLNISDNNFHYRKDIGYRDIDRVK